MSLSVVILTSAWSAFKYLDQYLFGLSQLKSISDQLDITLAFGSVSDFYDQKDHEQIRERVQEVCNEAGIKLHFYIGDKSETFYQTVNILIAQTIHFAENYAQINLDDMRFPLNLLEQIKSLRSNLMVYSDFICSNDVIKSYKSHNELSPDFSKIEGKVEETWPDVDMNNKEKYYREFRWSCFSTFKASLIARLGPFDEYYKSAGDLDFVNRALFFGVKPVKVPGLSGIFLSNGSGISTKPNSPGIHEGYRTLERYLLNKHPVNIYYGKKHLWRNL